MAYKRRRKLTARERELVAKRRSRREAYAKKMGFNNLEDKARYGSSPKLHRLLNQIKTNWDYNTLKDLDTDQRRSAVNFMKFRNAHPKKDDWLDPRFTDFIQEVTLADDEQMEQWIDQYVGGR